MRRPTGGGAIWHHHELTYALVVPESHPLARPSTQLYRAVHAAIVGWFGGLGYCEPFAEGKFFLQEIVSEADPYYALLTAVRKISFSRASRSWAVRSAGARGPSSSMGRFAGSIVSNA